MRILTIGSKRKTTFTTAAAVLGVAGLLVVMASLGGGPASPTGDNLGASETATPEQPPQEPWAEKAAALYSAWAGTPAEQQAAEVVVAHELNGAFSDCMDNRGYDRPWQDTVAPPPVPKDPLSWSFWGAGRFDGYYRQKVINAERGQRYEISSNSQNVSDEEAEAELACRRENPGASDETVDSLRDPAIARRLLADWAEAFAPVFVQGGDIQSYDQCVEQTGVLDELGGVESTEEASSLLSSPMPVGSVPLDGEDSTPEWEAYLEKEAALVAADWDCRKGVRASLGSAVVQALDTFETQHANRIDSAREHWESVRQQAIQLGWDSTAESTTTDER